MYVCMYMCVCVCMYVCICVCVCMCVCMQSTSERYGKKRETQFYSATPIHYLLTNTRISVAVNSTATLTVRDRPTAICTKLSWTFVRRREASST